MAERELDPEDGLPMCEAGEWAEDKHGLLRKYLDISKGPRRQFAHGTGGATYIELFAGPGRLFNRETGAAFDGSPLVACKEAARTNSQFTSVHLGDERPDFCEALVRRLDRIGITPRTYPHDARTAASMIIERLNPYGLNLAFLDPFGFEGLPFSLIETLAQFKRMDILIHVSAMELQRNLELYIQQPQCPLDTFAPGWRDVVRGMKPDIVARGKILEHWVSRIREAGFKEAKGKPLIRGRNNQALYWLVLIAKHDLATQFWDEISKEERQAGLF